MKENVIVSDRGQITLPSAMRKALGLGKNVVLTAEEVGGKIVLTPAVVVETNNCSAAQIADWDRADAFKENERTKLVAKLKKRRA